MPSFSTIDSDRLARELCKILGLPSVGMDRLVLVVEIGQPVRVYVRRYANGSAIPEQDAISSIVKLVEDVTVSDDGDVTTSVHEPASTK